MPFPQRKYDQVFMPEFGGAMENYGCVTWSDWFLYRSPPTAAERELRAKYLLHEMAHMWFGNIVTMRWWDDLWLNEAFAEFASNWAAVRATPYTDALAGHLARGKLRAYLLDQGPASHPIRQPVPDVAEAASIFDAITYPKGAVSAAPADDLPRRGQLRLRDDRLLRPARLGQHDVGRPDRRPGHGERA